VVVVIEGLGLPRSTRSSTYNAQYCSLFFRPWTLRVGDMIVPQFSLLGMDSKVLQGWYAARGESVAERPSCRLKRLTRKSKPEAMSELMSWKNAWDQYVQGNVVSQSGAKLIQRFLLSTMISRKKSDDDEQSGAATSEEESDLKPLELSSAKFHELLQTVAIRSSINEKVIISAIANAKVGKERLNKIKTRMEEYNASLRIGERIWKTDTSSAPECKRACTGHMFEDTFQEHLSALAVRGRNSSICEAPFDEKRDAAATFNAADHSTTTIDQAMASITSSSKKPKQKQLEFLEHFVRRLKVEWMEKHQCTINVNPDEPLLDLIHGFPGTGKSAMIAWMRQVMEEGLGWEHGVQFVCLAFQNAMAAQMG